MKNLNDEVPDIGYMGKKAVRFIMHTLRVINSCGVKIVLKTTGQGKTCFTITLAGLVKGTESKPILRKVMFSLYVYM